MRLPFALAVVTAVVGIPTLALTAIMAAVTGPFALIIPAVVVWQVGRRVNAARRRELRRRQVVTLR